MATEWTKRALFKATMTTSVLFTVSLRRVRGETKRLLPMIDFWKARLSWVTKGGIRGSWRIIASAQREEPVHECYYLAPAVMAGTVFGADRLPTDPAFSFQLIASRERHIILRHGVNGTVVNDSAAENTMIFRNLDIQVPTRAMKRVEFDDLSTEISSHWPLTARVIVDEPNGRSWTLQFPINHINDQPIGAEQKFQIETGPIIVPAELLPGFNSVGGLLLAYVFFSRLDRLDLLILGDDHPTTPTREFRHFARIERASVEIYSIIG